MAAVFAPTSSTAHQAVLHLRGGAPDVPVFLYCLEDPAPKTAALCERVRSGHGSVGLFIQAQRDLWPRRVALSVAAWTGDHGRWLLKLAPFLTPPFRALLLNSNGDFFRGSPGPILRHTWNRLSGALRGSVLGTFRGIVRHIQQRCVDFIWPYLLWIAARLLPVGYLHCRLFERLHGEQSLTLTSRSASGAGIAVFRQQGVGWPHGRLERFARSTTARWILWQSGSGVTIAPPFDEPETFAFSAQEHFRAWKPVLFPAAPFRALQPGEAAQVGAPLSNTILVDRAKLLMLGVPRCQFAATAWMILFWKAAAAGWRSYSLGRGGAPSEQPDSPIQETDFFLRTAFDRGLRRLGPREPAMNRGAAAFSAHHRGHTGGESGDRLRVLLVSPFLPYPLSHGGAVRIFNLCRDLAPQVDFCLIALREHGETVDYDKLHEVFEQVHIVDIDERAVRDPSLPEQVRGHHSAVLEALIARLADTWRPDLLQIEYTHMAAFRTAAPQIPAILVEHDLTLALYRQLAEASRSAKARAEYQRWHAFERRWLAAYDAVWTVSGDDRLAAIRERGRDPGAIFEIPNGVDTDRFLPSGAGGLEILYVGSFRHLPNILGFEKLRREVMPKVWEAFPEAVLRVVAGPRHEHFWQRFAPSAPLAGLDPRIEISGFVEDLRPFYATAGAVAVPLAISAGTNIKVLEAMACGKAIVSTPEGCAGLGLEPGREVLVVSNWEEFAAATCRLLCEPALRNRLGHEARRTAELRFSWEAIAASAFESYQSLTGSRVRVFAAGD